MALKPNVSFSALHAHSCLTLERGLSMHTFFEDADNCSMSWLSRSAVALQNRHPWLSNSTAKNLTELGHDAILWPSIRWPLS